MAPTRRNQASAVIPLDATMDSDVEYVKHRRSTTENNVTEEIQKRSQVDR